MYILNPITFLNRDYAQNELLDRYSDAGINDDEDLQELTIAARRAVDAQMDRNRARREGRGGRAARRSRALPFLEDDDMDDAGEDDVLRMKRRTRRQYDERIDIDDLDGVEDVRFTRLFKIVNQYIDVHRKHIGDASRAA